MKNIWKFSLFFVFCLLIGLLINLPVGHVLARVKIPEQIFISHLTGTLFEGQADTLVVNQVVFQNPEYKFNISCLITLSLCYQLKSTDGSAQVRFVPVDQSIEVSGLDVEISMSNLAGVSDQLLIKPSGSLYLSSDKVKFQQGQLTDIDAVLVWKNAGIAGEDIDLGDYQVSIAKQNGQYLVFFADKEAVLDIDGKGDLKPDGNYSLDINITAKSGLETRIKNALELVASKKGLRQYSIRRSGSSDKRLLSYLSFEGA